MKHLLLAAALLLGACAKEQPGRPGLAKAGLPAPELRLPRLLNSPSASLEGWRQLKGKAVVLEFWATWCEPCVDNIPHLNSLAAKFRGKPVVFISITDESEREVAAFLKEHKLDTWVAPEAGPAPFKAFRVYGRPHTVLIAPDGRVAAFTYPSEVTPETIEKLLAGRALPGDEPPEEEAGSPDPSVLGEFYIARSSGVSSVRYRRDHFTAKALSLRMAFRFLLGGADRIDLGPGTRELVDDIYDIRLTAPAAGRDRKPELFVKGLAFATGLKVSHGDREEQVFVLRRVPGGRAPKKAGDFGGVSFDGVNFVSKGASFAALALELGGRLGSAVLDETGEDGPLAYSFTFETRDPKVMDAHLRRDLGLRLERARRRVSVVTVRK